jgi:hypothetical protein
LIGPSSECFKKYSEFSHGLKQRTFKPGVIQNFQNPPKLKSFQLESIADALAFD